MKAPGTRLLCTTVVVAAAAIAGGSRPPSVPDNRLAVPATPPPQVPRLPTAFIPNLGQWDHDARYVARIGPMAMFLQQRGWSFTLTERPQPMANPLDRLAALDQPAQQPTRGVAVRMTFAGAGQPELVAEQRLPGVHHYFLGNDPAHWRSDVPLYAAVRYRGMHDGIDVRMREHQGHFEYDLLLAPLADLGAVEVDVEGIDGLHVDGDGALVMATALGPVSMPAPRTWEVGPGGEETALACSYVLRGARRFGFATPPRQDGWALVVDPGLVWSTFLGAGSGEAAVAVALDAQGVVTVAGQTYSAGFPTTVGAFDTSYNGGGGDVFVTRLSATGSGLVYSTFLGGSGPGGQGDFATGVAVDASGAATVVGFTTSTNFPTTPGAFATSHSGGPVDAFVTRLWPTGSSLVYSTLLGGAGNDEAHAVALTPSGATVVTGRTYSTNFPTTPGAFDTTLDGGEDAFVVELSATGSGLAYSTLLGGGGGEHAHAIAIDPQGAVTVAGLTSSTDFPTTPGAFDSSFNGGYFDAFVSRITSGGANLAWSTYLGGADLERVYAVALTAQGAAHVTGVTTSANFPTTPGAFDTTYNGNQDAFVSQIDPAGSNLVYSTFVGGVSDDYALAIACDLQGAATVAGATASADFPTTAGAFAMTRNGSYDAVVTRLSPTGASLTYSTFLGGSGPNFESANAIAVDAQGAATIAGETQTTTFPTSAGAFDPTPNGGNDAIVSRLSMLPTGVAVFGSSSPGCAGPVMITVNSQPRVGNAQFALTGGNAAPNSVGLIAFATSPLAAPLPVLGVDVWLDPLALVATATTTANAIGASNVPLPIPANPALVNLRFFAQFLWIGPAAPSPCPALGFSASNALDIFIQP